MTGVDATPRMVRMAADRVPGAVVLGDSRRLPFPDGAFDAVSTVWLLHLLSGPEEASRVVGEWRRGCCGPAGSTSPPSTRPPRTTWAATSTPCSPRAPYAPPSTAARRRGVRRRARHGARGPRRVHRPRPGPLAPLHGRRPARGWFTQIPPDAPWRHAWPPGSRGSRTRTRRARTLSSACGRFGSGVEGGRADGRRKPRLPPEFAGTATRLVENRETGAGWSLSRRRQNRKAAQ